MLFQTSAKKVRLQLEADLKTDLSHRKEEIGKLIQAVIDEMDDEDEDEEEGEEEEDEEEEEAPKKNGAVKNGKDKPAGIPTMETTTLTLFSSPIKMVEMKGTYERTAADKYDEFLTALGVNMLLRKAATASTPVMTVS